MTCGWACCAGPAATSSSNYHWAGRHRPEGRRPRRPELAWGGEESNRFGTDEFLAYCAELGTEPYICLNMGTGTLKEALAWVEYCNSARRHLLGRPRRANGHEEPYGVRYWGLGNEMYGDVAGRRDVRRGVRAQGDPVGPGDQDARPAAPSWSAAG